MPESQLQQHATSYEVRLFMAGGCAGALSKTVVAPFERVKIVCQTGASQGMVQSFVDIFKKEGVVGYWRGNLAACARILPHKGILFGCTDLYKDSIRRHLHLQPTEKLSPWYSVAAGSFSGMTASLLTYPLDFVRTRMAGQISANSTVGIVRTTLDTVKFEGVLALYRGVGPTLVGAIPYEGIKFGSYDFIRQMMDDWDIPANSYTKILCGGLAGMTATVLTYPNDTVRRRMQMQGQDGAKLEYTHAVDCYTKLFQRHGVGIFYRGLAPTLVRAMPNMGIQFSAYELLRQSFGCR